MILHYIGAAFFAWLILLVIAPQHTLLVTGVGVAWITGWIYIIAFAWLVALLLQPQATLAGTLTAWLLVWEKLYLWFV